MAKQQTVAVDFNGVLDTYKGWKTGGSGVEYPPREGAREFLQTLNDMGYTPVIFTCLTIHRVEEWLRRYEMWHLVHDVMNDKPVAIAYIDDRAITFRGNYGETLEQLVNFRTYWEDKE